MDGEPGVIGETAHVPVEVVCSTPSGTVTVLYPRTGANTVRGKEFSIVPATPRPVLTAMVWDSSNTEQRLKQYNDMLAF